MSQVDSLATTKSCIWDFNIEGDPSPVAGVGLGLGINPGESVLNASYKVINLITTSGNPAVDTISFYIATAPIAAFLIMTQTIDNYNLQQGLLVWGTNARYVPTGALQLSRNPNPIGGPGVYQLTAFATAPILSGSIFIHMNVQSDVM